MKPLLEKDIQSQILSLLRLKKCVAVKVPSGGAMTDKRGFIKMAAAGTADILACCPSNEGAIPVACEVKRPGGKVTDAQARFLDDWRDAGGVAFVATSVQDVIDEMEWR